MSEIDWKSKFLKTYANLPLASRDEIILVIEKEPITWNVARLEIEEDSIKGKQILDLLIRLNILKNE